MNIKQELEKMQDELEDLTVLADTMENRLDDIWWQLKDRIRKELD